MLVLIYSPGPYRVLCEMDRVISHESDLRTSYMSEIPIYLYKIPYNSIPKISI